MKERKQVTVIIDDREDDDVIADLATEFNLHDDVEEWRVDHLASADLSINGVGFERKTISDYVSSLMEQRLHEQVAKMKQQYEHAYILVEADMRHTTNPFEAANSNISPAAVRGSMASVTAREGLPVIHCSNRVLLADYAIRLARKHIEESDEGFLPKGAVTGTDKPTAMKMYGCIEGIGPEKAKALYHAWPSVMEFVAEANKENVADLEGFGEETAKKVLEGFM